MASIVSDSEFNPFVTKANVLVSFRELLEHGVDSEQHFHRSLQFAVEVSHLELVELLLVYGANPNHKDEDGQTPLHSAVRHGNARIPQLLLEY